MKTLYHDQNGTPYLATDAEELVSLMRQKADFDNSPTNERYMLLVAKRVLDQFGLTLSTESPEAFIASMLEGGLLTEGDAEDEK